MMGSINLTARAFTKQPSIDRRVFANDRRVFQIGRRVFLIGRRVFATGRRVFLIDRRVFATGRRVFLIGRRVSAKGYSEAVVRKGLAISAPSWTTTPARRWLRRTSGQQPGAAACIRGVRDSNSHYRMLFSLPDPRNLTTGRR